MNVFRPPKAKHTLHMYLQKDPSFIVMVVRLELAPICVAQSFLQHFAPFELHINMKTLLNTPLYEKYTFSERKLHEESKYDVQKCVGGRVRMSGLRNPHFWIKFGISFMCHITLPSTPTSNISSDLNSLWNSPSENVYLNRVWTYHREVVLSQKVGRIFWDIWKYQTCKFITDN